MESVNQNDATTNILVIDDEEQVRHFLQKTLKRGGYNVAEAPDGKVGLRMFHENKYDLIITDLIMPCKEGMEVIIELRRNYPDVKIIAISGGGQIHADDYLTLAKNLGAIATIAKPFSEQKLLETVNQALTA